MKKEFAKKVIREGIVDTEIYRYIYYEGSTRAEIRRIRLDALNTTAALNVQSESNPYGWEIVKQFR